MLLTRRVLLAVAFFLTAGIASAQTGPQLLTVFPVGAKAGSTVEVTVSGHGLDGAESLLFSAKGFKAEPVGTPTATKGQQGQPTSTAKFKVTVPKDAKGTIDVRVVAKTGLSNPRAFVGGDTTDVNETEPNSDVGQAQKIDLDTTVNGVISAPTDVDYVTFKAQKGQNVTVYCLTTSLDSRMQADLAVMTLAGKPVASNRGYRDGDAVCDFQAPEDGEYLVRLAQFAYTTGGFDHFYRLTVTTKEWVDALYPPVTKSWPTPFTRKGPGIQIKDIGRFAREDALQTDRAVPPTTAMIDAVESPASLPGGHPVLHNPSRDVVLDNEKNNTPETAQEVKLPCDVAGRIAKKNERHWYSFSAKKGDVWTLEVFADRIGSPVDAFFILTDDKGKVIVEQDDGADSLSPNQFFTKGDDPARYKFIVPADGTYKVMVSTREAGVQFGVRDQYVLRIAKEKPDFRVAVMPFTPHLLDSGTLPKGGAAVFAVYVFRFDGFDGAIELGAENLPEGVKMPTQVIGPGQTRGTLVLVADKDADDWDGFVKITARSGELKSAVRPFSVVWPAVGVQANQPPPNSPMLTRMDRGEGMALAVRGDAPFTLTPTDTEVTVKPGGKLDVTLKVTRDSKFKDAIQVFSATPNLGPRQQGNQPVPPVGTAAANATEVKLSLDVANALPPGTHTLILRGQTAAPPPKGGGGAPVRIAPTYAAIPITVTVEGTPPKKK